MSGPPSELERAVLWLVPPCVREEVAGDLAERYSSAPVYLAEFLLTVPYVIWSQLRRGTDWPLFLLIGFTLIASLGGLEPQRASTGAVAVPPRALIGGLPCLAILLLRNAYRRNEIWGPRRAAGDMAWLAIALVSTQIGIGIAAPAWHLPLGWLIGGLVFTGTVMALLRSEVELANTGLRPGVTTIPAPAKDYRQFQRNLRLRRTIETAALAVLALFAGWLGLTADRAAVSFVAGAWAAVTLILVAHRWHRENVRVSAGKLAIPEVLPRYIADLKLERSAKSFALWWYFVPLFAGIGFSTIAFGVISRQPMAGLAGLLTMAMLAMMIERLGACQRERLTEKITQLEGCMQA
jgi:hypothetical protein